MKTVEVTTEDIKNGQPGDCYKCAVALAANRALADMYEKPFGPRASVAEDSLNGGYHLDVDGRIFHLPAEIGCFVIAFDAQDEGLEPFDFEIPEFGQWFERCSRCDEESQSDSLDSEGVCEECRDAYVR